MRLKSTLIPDAFAVAGMRFQTHASENDFVPRRMRLIAVYFLTVGLKTTSFSDVRLRANCHSNLNNAFHQKRSRAAPNNRSERKERK